MRAIRIGWRHRRCSFTSFYTSVRNRRVSRAGKVLEIHIAHILDARGIEYEAQAKTENGKKPDFLFPSQAAYEDPASPRNSCVCSPRKPPSRIVSASRRRSQPDQGQTPVHPDSRRRDHPKLAQLDELHIHLVMPKVVKESYDDLIQEKP